MSEGAPKVADQRGQARHLTCMSAQLASGEGRAGLSIVSDLSVTGARAVTLQPFQVGEPVDLTLHLDRASKPHEVKATVVRCAPAPQGEGGFWKFELGLRFDAPLEHLRAEIERAAGEQAALAKRFNGK